MTVNGFPFLELHSIRKLTGSIISEYLEIQLAEIKKAKLSPLIYFGLRHRMDSGGQSLPYVSVFQCELVDRSTTKGKKPTKLCSQKLYLPATRCNRPQSYQSLETGVFLFRKENSWAR